MSPLTSPIARMCCHNNGLLCADCLRSFSLFIRALNELFPFLFMYNVCVSEAPRNLDCVCLHAHVHARAYPVKYHILPECSSFFSILGLKDCCFALCFCMLWVMSYIVLVSLVVRLPWLFSVLLHWVAAIFMDTSVAEQYAQNVWCCGYKSNSAQFSIGKDPLWVFLTVWVCHVNQLVVISLYMYIHSTCSSNSDFVLDDLW